MKKIQMAVAIAVVALTFTACMGNNSAGNTTKTKSSMEQTEMQGKDDMKDDMKDGMKGDMKDEMKGAKMEQKNEGNMAPEFTLKDGEGKALTLADMQGKKVYLKFWASWCPVCLAGLEELNELSKDNTDFEVISVIAPGMSGEKNKEDFAEWFNSLGYENIRIYYDESGEVSKSYGIRAFPTSAVIGSDGVLIGVQPGPLDNETLKQVFETVQ